MNPDLLHLIEREHSENVLESDDSVNTSEDSFDDDNATSETD